jgi:hypothetical protein
LTQLRNIVGSKGEDPSASKGDPMRSPSDGDAQATTLDFALLSSDF